jgi:hypothetical protein
MTTPLRQYVYGNLEEGTALTIDVWPEDAEWPDRYQARVWVNGDTAALEYFDTFAKCVSYFGTLDTEQEYEKDSPPKANAIAPRTSGGSGYAWLLVTDGQWERDNDWWEAGEKDTHPDIILFSEMQEES